MQILVVKLNSLNDNKQKPMKAVSSLQGIVSIEVNTNDSKITIIGDMDPILAVKKLQKWLPKIESLGPAKEDKKPATDNGNNDKVLTVQEQINAMYAYSTYNTHYAQPSYYVHNYDENPNSCVIS